MNTFESFIAYKAQTGMQCGSYSIDPPKLRLGSSTASTSTPPTG